MNIWYLCFRQGFPGISNLIRSNLKWSNLIRLNPTGPHPVETEKPHPFESRKDPIERNRRTSSGRSRLNPTGPHPVEANRPSAVETQAGSTSSGQTSSGPTASGNLITSKQPHHIQSSTAYPVKHIISTQNSSIFKHEEGKETFEVHIRLSAGGASGAQPYVGAALQGCAGEVDSAHAQAQHRICR